MTTRVNPKCRLEDQGIEGLGRVYYNLPEPALITEAVVRGEGRLGLGGAFLVSTGAHTGRSPKDKFVVRTPDVEDSIWWDNNAAMAPDAFDRLHHDMLAHMQGMSRCELLIYVLLTLAAHAATAIPGMDESSEPILLF